MSILYLFYLRWKHSNKEVRLCAVKKLNDKKILAKIAKNDPEEDIRKAAVQKLKKQDLLIEIAQSDPSYVVRCIAAEKSQNKDLLVKIVQEETLMEDDTVFSIRQGVVRNLEDQAEPQWST